MQYFLRPRRIVDCPAGEGMVPCVQSLTGASTSILAVPDFPPRSEASQRRVYIEYADGLGVYSPRPTSGAPPAEQLPCSVILDVLVVLLLAARCARRGLPDGSRHTRHNSPEPRRGSGSHLRLQPACGHDKFDVGPLSALVVEGPLTIWTLLLTGMALLALWELLAWRRHTSRAAAAGWDGAPRRRVLPSMLLGWAACMLIVAASLVLSVARSYSTWDDMAAYSIQGYGIARIGP